MTGVLPPAPSVVLLVENDPLQRDLIALALRRLPVEVVAVASGDEALRQVARLAPKVTLLDMHLERENGLQVLHRLKKAGLRANAAVIVFSYYGFPEVVRQALEAGATDFLVSPFDLDLLVSRVRAALLARAA